MNQKESITDNNAESITSDSFPSTTETPQTSETPPAQQNLHLTKTQFSELGLSENVMKGLAEAGYVYCTPIQEKTFTYSLKGKDVAGQAQTGTGKTAAFLVTVLHMLEKRPASGEHGPRVLILAPTRELVQQISEECELLGKHTGFSSCPVFGGIDYRKQAGDLRKGVDIVIATPGRLIDYFKQKVFVTDNIEMLVIDEADRMFDMGFVKDIRYILRRLPPYAKRQSLLFSATLGYRVMELTYEFMNIPEEISIAPNKLTLENIRETLVHVESVEKLRLLLGLLSRNSWERILIFCNTKSGVDRVAEKLRGNGMMVEGITGDLPQRKRLSIMKAFKAGELSILVATDVASRGIHVEDIDAVINYDLPQDAESYVHRIGRTGRVGKMGEAVSLADEKYVFHLEAIESLLKKKIPVVWPEEDWFLEDKAPKYISKRRVEKVPMGRRGSRKPSFERKATERKPAEKKTAEKPPRQRSRSRSPKKSPSSGADA